MDLGYSWPALGRELDMQFGSLSKELFMDGSMSQIKLRLRKVKQIIQDHMVMGKTECCLYLCYCPTFQEMGPGSGVLEPL